jgi:hypothetical protein
LRWNYRALNQYRTAIDHNAVAFIENPAVTHRRIGGNRGKCLVGYQTWSGSGSPAHATVGSLPGRANCSERLQELSLRRPCFIAFFLGVKISSSSFSESILHARPIMGSKPICHVAQSRIPRSMIAVDENLCGIRLPALRRDIVCDVSTVRLVLAALGC